MIMVIFQNAFVSGRENLASSPDTLDLPDPAYDAEENAFVSGRDNLASSPDTLDLPDPVYDAKE